MGYTELNAHQISPKTEQKEEIHYYRTLETDSRMIHHFDAFEKHSSNTSILLAPDV